MRYLTSILLSLSLCTYANAEDAGCDDARSKHQTAGQISTTFPEESRTLYREFLTETTGKSCNDLERLRTVAQLALRVLDDKGESRAHTIKGEGLSPDQEREVFKRLEALETKMEALDQARE